MLPRDAWSRNGGSLIGSNEGDRWGEGVVKSPTWAVRRYILRGIER